jgi:hypothetical protein
MRRTGLLDAQCEHNRFVRRLSRPPPTLQVGGAPVHDYQVRIGFREARFGLDGFFLNGRRVKLFGVNRHQFYPFAMPARVQRSALRSCAGS